MVDVNIEDIKKKFDEIKKLIAFNNLDRAFKRFLDFVNDFGNEAEIFEAIAKHREYIDIKMNIRKDLNTGENRDKLIKLTINSLEFLNEIYNQYIELNNTTNIEKKENFVKELKISSYKILNNFYINFQDNNKKTLKTIVLAGINGSGKTSILEYILYRFDNAIYFPVIINNLEDSDKVMNYPEKLVEDKLKGFVDNIKDKNLDLTVREANQKAIDSINEIFKDIEISVKFCGFSNDSKRELIFENTKSSTIRLKELSTGEQQLFIRALSLKLLELKNKIILIDEPETSLHPSWQQQILKVYENIAKDGNNQLIVATHSPHIISSAKKESVKILVNVNGDIKVLENIKGSYGFEVSRVLTQLMGLKSLRIPEIAQKIEKLWDLIHEDRYEEEEFKNLYEELKTTLGLDDKDVILSKLEIAKKKSKKC